MRRAKVQKEGAFLSIPGWQKQILDKRLADLEEHPEDEQTWDEVKAELWSRRSRAAAE